MEQNTQQLQYSFTELMIYKMGVPFGAQGKLIWLVTTRLHVRSLASLSGLRICRCHELWCRSQTQLKSCVAMAVAQASGCSSNSTPTSELSYAAGAALKSKSKKKKKIYIYIYKTTYTENLKTLPSEIKHFKHSPKWTIYEAIKLISVTIKGLKS